MTGQLEAKLESLREGEFDRVFEEVVQDLEICEKYREKYGRKEEAHILLALCHQQWQTWHTHRSMIAQVEAAKCLERMSDTGQGVGGG